MCRAEHAGQKLSAIQWSHHEPSCTNPSPASPDASQTVTTKDRICHIVGFEISLSQVF